MVNSLQNGLPVVAMKLEFGEDVVELFRDYGEFPDQYYSYLDGTTEEQDVLMNHYEFSEPSLTIAMEEDLDICSDPQNVGFVIGGSEAFLADAQAGVESLSIESIEELLVAFINSEELHNAIQPVSFRKPTRKESPGGILGAFSSVLAMIGPSLAHAQTGPDFPDFDPMSSLEDALDNAIDNMWTEAGKQFGEGNVLTGVKHVVLDGAVGAVTTVVEDAGDYCVDALAWAGHQVTEACVDLWDDTTDAIGDMCSAIGDQINQACAGPEWWEKLVGL